MFKIKKKLSEMTDMPMSSFGSCPYVGVEGNRIITVYEVEEIIDYTEEKTVLKLKGLTLSVIGEGLSINSYGGGTVKLSGFITSISYDPDKKECRHGNI